MGMLGGTTTSGDPHDADSSIVNPLLPRATNRQDKTPVTVAPVCCSNLPYADGVVPGNATTEHPKGRPVLQTFFGDTPAPFECPFCTYSGITELRSSLSGAAVMGAVVTIIGVCFLAPGSVLWHKQHFCPACNTKVGELVKDDLFLVADPMSWRKPSYAVLG